MKTAHTVDWRPAPSGATSEWVTLESLRHAYNWGFWDSVMVTVGGARRFEQVTNPTGRGVLELVFAEDVLKLTHVDAVAVIKAAILPHVPQWRFEAHAHFPWDLKQP